jgi:hypothetical protein
MKKLILLLGLLCFTNIIYADDSPLQLKPIIDFSGGLNTKLAKNLVPDNQCYDCQNIDFDETFGIKTRKGFVEISSFPVSGKTATKLFEYVRANGEKFLISQIEDSLYYTTSKTEWTLFKTGLKWQLNSLQAAVYDNKIWFTNGIDDVFYFDGTNTVLLDFVPKGKYIITHNNKLFIANTFDNPSNVYYVLEGFDPTFEGSWLEDNFEVAGFQDGDIVTGLASYRQFLIVFKKFSTWAILGYIPETWQVTSLNNNYGCLYQESIHVDKGILKFMSHVGMVAFDGSSIRDIDVNVENIFIDSNNVAGEFNYLQISSNDDWKVGSSIVRVSTITAELSLESQVKFFFDEDTFVTGSTSNINISGDTLELSPVSDHTPTRVEPISFRTYIEEPPKIFPDNPDSDNLSFSAWEDIDNQLSPEVFDIFQDEHRILDNQVNSIAYIKNEHKFKEIVGYVGGQVNNKDVSFYTFNFDIGEDIYTRISLHNLIHELKNIEGSNDLISVIRISARDPLTDQWKRIGFKSQKQSSSDNRILYNNLNIDFSPFKTSQIKVMIGITFGFAYSSPPFNIGAGGYTGPIFTPTKIRQQHSILQVGEIKVYKASSSPVYQSTGVYTSTSTLFGDSTYNVQWGTFTVDSFSSFDVLGTTLAFFVRSSEDNITFSSYEKLEGNFDSGVKIPSTSGKYLQWKSSFTTNFSTNTPVIYEVQIEALPSTGTYITKKFNLGKVNTWKYFIADDKLNSQTANYYIKLATGSTELDSASFVSIDSGDLISGTSNQVHVQYKVDLETTDGTQNPVVFSLTTSYAPEAEPIIPSVLSIKDRYWIAISTGNDSNNNIVMIHDLRNVWTKFIGMNVSSFVKFGKEYYFADNTLSKIYQLESGTTDNGTSIISSWKKRFDMNLPDNDKNLQLVYITGLQQTSGTLNLKYSFENNTTINTIPIDLSGTGLLSDRNRIPNHSAVKYWDLILDSTDNYELHKLSLYYTFKELR